MACGEETLAATPLVKAQEVPGQNSPWADSRRLDALVAQDRQCSRCRQVLHGHSCLAPLVQVLMQKLWPLHPKLLMSYLVVRSLATRGLIDRHASSLSMEGSASTFLTTPWAGGVGGAAYWADTAIASSVPSRPLWAWLPHGNPHPTLLPSPDPEDALGPQGLCPGPMASRSC